MAESSEKRLLSVVMPAYNEENTISEIVSRVLQIPQLLELIIVDDGSIDKTQEIARSLAKDNPRITYIRQARNGGKTSALKTGFAATTGQIVIVQDADLEYDPAEITDVIAPIINDVADVVYGSRLGAKKSAGAFSFCNYLANTGLTFLSNRLTNINVTDVETCYKAFRGEIIRNMALTSSGFGFEIEVTAKIAKLKCSFAEIPVSYHGRTYKQGKKIGFKDGLDALWYIIKFNLLVGTKDSPARESTDVIFDS